MTITANFTEIDNNTQVARWFDGQGNMIELTYNPRNDISRVKAFVNDWQFADEIIIDDSPVNYEFLELGENLFSYYFN